MNKTYTGTLMEHPTAQAILRGRPELLQNFMKRVGHALASKGIRTTKMPLSSNKRVHRKAVVDLPEPLLQSVFQGVAVQMALAASGVQPGKPIMRDDDFSKGVRGRVAPPTTAEMSAAIDCWNAPEAQEFDPIADMRKLVRFINDLCDEVEAAREELAICRGEKEGWRREREAFHKEISALTVAARRAMVLHGE